ncbi:HlyD family efflux transporter periplasmic adaptor subunit [Desulfobacterales bacterium HSG2]|nr:HlyD family efflux transporter periplasmic adaptor subunit [Desulfobacterales bacterium HSG2]
MTPSENQLLLLSTLLQLEKQARHAETPAELNFIIVNETLRLTNYRQAILWEKGPTGRIRIEAVSGTDRPDPNSPFVIYMRGLLKNLIRQSDKHKIHTLQEEDLKEKYRSGWQEWSVGAALWCPLITPRGEMPAGLLFTRRTEWDKGEIALLERLADAYAHARQALRYRKRTWRIRLKSGWHKRGLQLLLFVILVLLMGLPVRLSVLAPAEIVPSGFFIVSSSMDGVIQQFYMQPNQEVKTGQPLFRLDDTAIRNEYEVSKKALGVARAEYKRTAQKAFTDKESRANLLLLKAQIEQKSAQADYMAEMLARSEVLAPYNGIALFGDVHDWIGKPVVTGEKVLIIADPARVEAEIRLPVADAINLDTGAEVLIFLNVEPDRPLPAKLRQASYDAHLTPDGILAFRLKSSFVHKGKTPRIGLRGTAKIYGKEVTLFYYLMRRPLAALRQYFGI